MNSDWSQLQVTDVPGGAELSVKVVPGASRTKIAGLWNGALRVAVAAPPEAGKANAALCEFLAALFGVRKQDIQITIGQTNPQKRIRISDRRADQVRAALESAQ